MSFRGGSFVTQNKLLPGVYVNLTQQSRASSAISDRGVAAMGVELDWGPEGAVFYVTESEFRADSGRLFGYSYGDGKLKGLRELFRHAAGCWLYRLNGGVKAQNGLCTARYAGERGNDLQIYVAKQEEKYVVSTHLAGQEVDAQLVAGAGELQDNDFVCWKPEAELSEGYLALSGGSSNKADTAAYQAMLAALEGCDFNTLGCIAMEQAVQELFLGYTREQREDNGRKFQTVLYRCGADYEGIISAGNRAVEADWPESSFVYWLTGAEAGCAMNGTLTNQVYDGELALEPVVGQKNLQAALEQGRLVLHRLGEELRILEDVNSLTSWRDSAALEDRRFNQTVRVLDQIVLDLGSLFYQRYLGVVPNDTAGRISLWNDVVTYLRRLEGLRAIEGFNPDQVEVLPGENKKAVVIGAYLTVVNAMAQMYLSITFA